MLLLRGQSFKAYLGVRFFEKIQIWISESKTDFASFWANPKTDHESIKSTLCEWILRIKSKSGFLRFTI